MPGKRNVGQPSHNVMGAESTIESYEAGDDENAAPYGTDNTATIYCMTFSMAANNRITKLSFLAWRIGTPGTFIIKLIGTTGADRHPDPTTLYTTDTYNGNLLGAVSPGAWFDMTLSSPIDLLGNAARDYTYGILLHGENGKDINNRPVFRCDKTAPGYTPGGLAQAGRFYESLDSGATWNPFQVNSDLLFKVNGQSATLTKIPQGYVNGFNQP